MDGNGHGIIKGKGGFRAARFIYGNTNLIILIELASNNVD